MADFEVPNYTPAELASLSVEAFLNGVHFTLFCLSTYFMAKRHREKNCRSPTYLFRDPLFLGSTLMSGMSIAHWALAIEHSFMAFIQNKLGTPEYYYADLGITSFVAQTVVVFGMLVVGNITLFYRLWTIWERNPYVMVIPIASFIPAIVCALALIADQVQSGSNPLQSEANAKTWLQGAFISDIFANVTSGVLITWKLWHEVQRTPGRQQVYWLISVLVESSALYVGWEIVFTAIYDSGSPVWRAFLDTWVPICGIYVALINVRVGMDYIKSRSTAVARRLPDAYCRVAFGDSAFAITITREVETDYTDEEFTLSPQVNSVDSNAHRKSVDQGI